ncbi:Epidermal growth factor-like protein 7 [Oopsacas minuta]|uniref:Epidermal growth factor-like protein 7 n=1 Tax=Oopsacas minuta TaxID=111878 RepID=A0AAV7KH87_9METZ|nr:Epidermal growth factor-like protein 7 [Oopsacas minuta]
MYYTESVQVPCCCEGYGEVDSDTCRPQCTQICQNEGVCTQPDTCSCPLGWTGHDCSTDVNECNSNPCQQKCENTDGSYSCSCHLGFYKQPDNINNCFQHTARLHNFRVRATDSGHLTVHWKLNASFQHTQLLQTFQLNYSYPLNEDMEVRSLNILPTQSQVSTSILYPGIPVHFKFSLIYKSDLLQENQPNLDGITQIHFRVPDPNMERCLNYYNLEQFVKNRISGNSTYTPSPCSEETVCIDQSTTPYYFCQ